MRTVEHFPVSGRYEVELLRNGEVLTCIFAGHSRESALATLTRWRPTSENVQARIVVWVNPDMGRAIVNGR